MSRVRFETPPTPYKRANVKIGGSYRDPFNGIVKVVDFWSFDVGGEVCKMAECQIGSWKHTVYWQTKALRDLGE